MRLFSWLLAAASIALLAFGWSMWPAHAAPALKTADELVGQFDLSSLESPTLVFPGNGIAETQRYWLVFTSQDVEAQARKCQTGDRVKATGKLGVGGGYRYLVVSAIAKDTE